MKRSYCDICNKEFKWYDGIFQLGGYENSLDICRNCLNKVMKFVKELKEAQEIK